MTLPRDALASPPADGLRAWGLSHPAVTFLLGVLPPYVAAAAPHEPGLYAETARAPWIHVKGELRVSLVRLLSVTTRGTTLVAQVQVTQRPLPAGAPLRRLRGYVHDDAVGVSREVPGLDAWWLAVLAAHYARGGPSVDFGEHAPVSP